MRGIGSIDPGWGVTAVRVAMGIIFIGAGYSKVMGGLATVTGSFAKMGIPLPGVSGPFIALLELVGGVLLLIGLFSRWLGLLYFLEFIVATFFVKVMGPGFNAGRLDLMLLVGGLLLFLAGGGRASVDELWLERERGPALTPRRAA